MTTAVKLNGTTINHKDGLIYLDNLNETLDSGVIVCEGIEKTEINPMDEIEITLPNNTKKKFLVSEYVEEVASYNPPLYNYQIQYVSPVLKFERITLPNLAITKTYKNTNVEDYLIAETLTGGVVKYVRSVGYYIRQFFNEYYTDNDCKIRSYEDVMVKADATICPEMTFNKPNLREVMQALFDVMDLIFTLRISGTDGKYVITSISPNERKNAIDTSKLNSDVTRNSVNTYASNLDVELSNAISSPKNLNKTSQILTLRTDTGILTTDNAKLILENPIYTIDKIEVNVTAIKPEDDAEWNEDDRPSWLRWVDITKFVFEESVYEALDTTGGTVSKFAKDNTLYYKQGGNTIEGFGRTHKWLGIFDSSPVLSSVLNCATPYDEFGYISFYDFVEYHFFEIMFRVEYTTIQDVRIQTERTNKLAHHSTLFDSQEASYVNVDNFTKNSISKLNRMSNNERTISALYTNYSDIPQLGDYIDDYILTNREISIFDNYIVFNGVLTKNYSNIYQFNAINSKKRFYQISTDETLVRHELIKYYLEYSYTKDTLEGASFNSLSLAFALQTSKKPKFVLINYGFKGDDGTNYIKTRFIAKEVTLYQAGETALLTFGFDNNINGGSRVGSKSTGGYYMSPIKYTDDYGENTKIIMDFYKGSNYFEFTNGTDYRQFWEDYGKYYPMVYEDDVYKLFGSSTLSLTSNHHKDQREIQKFTIQFTQVSNEPDIIIGPRMKERNMFTKTEYQYEDNIQYLEVWRFPEPLDKNNLENVDWSKGQLIEDTRPYVGIDDGNYIKAKHSGNIVFVDAQYRQATQDYDRYVYLVLNNYTAETKIYCNVKEVR